MVTRLEGELLQTQSEEKPQEVKIINPLDKEILNLENGYIPGWARVVSELNIQDLPRGEKKLFRSFYRAHKFYARGRRTKGRELIQGLLNKKHFLEFENKYSQELDQLVNIVSRGARKRS